MNPSNNFFGEDEDMNAFELKEMLSEYTDEELQALQLRVFTNMDIEEGETTIVDSVEVTDWELIKREFEEIK